MERRKVLLLSGAVAAGKSATAKVLVDEHAFRGIRSGTYLLKQAQAAGLDASRRGLQELGDSKDVETDFGWLIDEVACPLIDSEPLQRSWLLDCARKEQQVEHFRRRFPGQVVHVHLIAPEAELRRRYDARLAKGGEYLGGTSYDEAVSHPNEAAARALSTIADVVLDTSRDDVLAEVLVALALLRASGR